MIAGHSGTPLPHKPGLNDGQAVALAALPDGVHDLACTDVVPLLAHGANRYPAPVAFLMDVKARAGDAKASRPTLAIRSNTGADQTPKGADA